MDCNCTIVYVLNPEDALEIYGPRAIAVEQKALGEEHPSVATTLAA